MRSSALLLVREPTAARPVCAVDIVSSEPIAKPLVCDVCRSRSATVEDGDRPACLCARCARRHEG